MRLIDPVKPFIIPSILLILAGFLSYVIVHKWINTRSSMKDEVFTLSKRLNTYKEKADKLNTAEKEFSDLKKEIKRFSDRFLSVNSAEEAHEFIKNKLKDLSQVSGVSEIELKPVKEKVVDEFVKVKFKARYESKNAKNILNFIKDIEREKAIFIEAVDIKLDKPNLPTKYILEIEVFSIWVQK